MNSATAFKWIKQNDNNIQDVPIKDLVINAFKLIAPFWPLKNLIAVNPLYGFEEILFEEALKLGELYFQQREVPSVLHVINRQTIKWLQAYFDQGQAKIPMPLRQMGLYHSWRQLCIYDKTLYSNDKEILAYLTSLPENAEQAIVTCLAHIGIQKTQYENFMILMLTTLPGWASHVKYLCEWSRSSDSNNTHRLNVDYMALRLILTCVLWPQAKSLLAWHDNTAKRITCQNQIERFELTERNYAEFITKMLVSQRVKQLRTPAAQLVFCIDVRSEPFRKALEQMGEYQTYGFAGFFGIPVKITDPIIGETRDSCPVLIAPKYNITELPCNSSIVINQQMKAQSRFNLFKRLYQSMKYTFTTPLILAEVLGIPFGIWMTLRSLTPNFAHKLQNLLVKIIKPPIELRPIITEIPFEDQCNYAANSLEMIGLTHHFAETIIFCGHGSTTQNNAYASSLDCGACGGQHGASNARILANILNSRDVRKNLAQKGLCIPEKTIFLAAEHNTTTDEVTIYGDKKNDNIIKIKKDLERARAINNYSRMKKLTETSSFSQAIQKAHTRSQDWAQIRPEWGLARNAAFIIAPRDITASIDLDGRCFLHSYDYTNDSNGDYLTVILTAPLIVAQWINMQYLFSTLDNVAFGGGSKITKNITGKFGIMQGNASDLMTGLPLQSVYKSDVESYHEPKRLLAVVYVPPHLLTSIIQQQPVLVKLLGNGWINMSCIDPSDHQLLFLNRDFTWRNAF